MKTRLLFLPFLLFILTSCATSSAQEKRKTQPFIQISINRGVEVFFTQSSSYSLRVEGNSADVSKVTTKVKNNTLEISTENNSNSRNRPKIKVYVSAPELKEIKLSSGSNFHCTDLKCRNSFSVNASSGAGIHINRLKASGKTNIQTSSGAECKITKLETSNCSLNASGGGTLKVDLTVSGNVDAKASGGADLKLKGHAKNVKLYSSGGSSIDVRNLKYNHLDVKKSGGADIYQ